eukprot:5299110-Prymnesium_polylepis.1
MASPKSRVVQPRAARHRSPRALMDLRSRSKAAAPELCLALCSLARKQRRRALKELEVPLARRP